MTDAACGQVLRTVMTRGSFGGEAASGVLGSRGMTAHLYNMLAMTNPESSGSAGTILQQSPEYVAGWGTLALINAGLAQGKNRSGMNWFLLSLFMGPVATFFLVALCERLTTPPAKAGQPIAETTEGS